MHNSQLYTSSWYSLSVQYSASAYRTCFCYQWNLLNMYIVFRLQPHILVRNRGCAREHEFVPALRLMMMRSHHYPIIGSSRSQFNFAAFCFRNLSMRCILANKLLVRAPLRRVTCGHAESVTMA